MDFKEGRFQSLSDLDWVSLGLVLRWDCFVPCGASHPPWGSEKPLWTSVALLERGESGGA